MSLSIKVYINFKIEEDNTFIFFSPNSTIDKVNPIQYGNFITAINETINKKLINEENLGSLFIKINCHNYAIDTVYDNMSYFDIVPYINLAFSRYLKPSNVPKELFIYPYIEGSSGILSQELIVNKGIQMERIFIQFPLDTEHETSLTKVLHKYFDYLTTHEAFRAAGLPLSKFCVELAISEHSNHEVQSITTPSQVFYLKDVMDDLSPIFDFIKESNLHFNQS